MKLLSIILTICLITITTFAYAENVIISYKGDTAFLNGDSEIMKRFIDDGEIKRLVKKMNDIINKDGDIEAFTEIAFRMLNHIVQKYDLSKQYRIINNVLSSVDEKADFKTKILLSGVIADLSKSDMKLMAAIRLTHLALGVPINYTMGLKELKEINFSFSCNIKMYRYYYDMEKLDITFTRYLLRKWNSFSSNIYDDEKKWIELIEHFLTTI